MRISFILLCISTCLEAINTLLHAIIARHGFLGLYPFDFPLRDICRLVFYLSMLNFCSYAYATMSKYRWHSDPGVAKKNTRPPGEVAGIALGSLLSFFFVIAIMKQTQHLFNVAYIYSFFLISSGLLMQTSGNGWRTSLAGALWPAGSFLVSAFLAMLLSLYVPLNESHTWHLSASDWKLNMVLSAAFTALSMIAIPAITIIDLGRKAVLNLSVAFSDANKGSLHPLVRNTSFALTALALVATAVMIAKASND